MASRPNDLGALIRLGRLKAAKARVAAQIFEEIALETERCLIDALEAINSSYASEYRDLLTGLEKACLWLLEHPDAAKDGSDDHPHFLVDHLRAEMAKPGGGRSLPLQQRVQEESAELEERKKRVELDPLRSLFGSDPSS